MYFANNVENLYSRIWNGHDNTLYLLVLQIPDTIANYEETLDRLSKPRQQLSLTVGDTY